MSGQTSGRLGRVSVAVAPLRREPSHASECVTQALHGEEFETLESAPDPSWIRVRLRSDSYEGWLRTWYGVAADPGPPFDLRVRTRSAEVREAAKAGAAILTALPWQSQLLEKERMGAWVRVRLADGRDGFVPSRQLQSASPAGGRATPKRLWNTARWLLGCPYLWGGRSVWGFDCSGLVQAVFAWHGLAIPRDSRDLLAVARPRGRRAGLEGGIYPGRLRKGDLLLFGPEAGPPAHVALSGGDGEFVHAYCQVCLGSLKEGSQHIIPQLVKSFIGVARWGSFGPP